MREIYLLQSLEWSNAVHLWNKIEDARKKLNLNESKTELFLIASFKHAKCFSYMDFKLEIGGSVIVPSDTVKNLCITFDDNLPSKGHVNSLCISINFRLRNLSRIRQFIDRSSCAHAVGSFILSRLDYDNSLRTWRFVCYWYPAHAKVSKLRCASYLPG